MSRRGLEVEIKEKGGWSRYQPRCQGRDIRRITKDRIEQQNSKDRESLAEVLMRMKTLKKSQN